MSFAVRSRNVVKGSPQGARLPDVRWLTYGKNCGESRPNKTLALTTVIATIKSDDARLPSAARDDIAGTKFPITDSRTLMRALHASNREGRDPGGIALACLFRTGSATSPTTTGKEEIEGGRHPSVIATTTRFP